MPLIALLAIDLEGRLSSLEGNYDNSSLHSFILCAHLNHFAHCYVHSVGFETGWPILNQVNGHKSVRKNYSYIYILASYPGHFRLAFSQPEMAWVATIYGHMDVNTHNGCGRACSLV